MTDRELMQQALNALITAEREGNCEYGATEALRARLAQPEPEPEKSLSQRMREAGFTPRDTRLECDGCGKKFSRLMLPIHDCDAAQPEPTADEWQPPQREWVGLTDEEIREFELWLDDEEEKHGWNPPADIVKYLEAKLKEKNA